MLITYNCALCLKSRVKYMDFSFVMSYCKKCIAQLQWKVVDHLQVCSMSFQSIVWVFNRKWNICLSICNAILCEKHCNRAVESCWPSMSRYAPWFLRALYELSTMSWFLKALYEYSTMCEIFGFSFFFCYPVGEAM